MEFKAVRKITQFSYVIPVTEQDIKEFKETGIIKCKGFSNFRVSISDSDKYNNKSPKLGDVIAINPKDKTDQWLIEKQFYEDSHVTDIEIFGIQPVTIKL